MYAPLVLRETLETRGVFGQLKAQIRAELYKALESDEVTMVVQSATPLYASLRLSLSLSQIKESPQLPDEAVIINALIKEYLQFSGYNYTHSVFQTGVYTII